MVTALKKDPDMCIILNPAMRPKTGMPRVTRDGKRWSLHRYLLFRATGETPHEALIATCPTEHCLNPFHMERSMRRGLRVRTHCPNGHEYTPSNIAITGRYKCKKCIRDRKARMRKGKYGRGYCRSGHKLTAENSYFYRTTDGRILRKCRTCTIDNQRRYRERKKEQHG